MLATRSSAKGEATAGVARVQILFTVDGTQVTNIARKKRQAV